jgi:hypothetical protein
MLSLLAGPYLDLLSHFDESALSSVALEGTEKVLKLHSFALKRLLRGLRLRCATQPPQLLRTTCDISPVWI